MSKKKIPDRLVCHSCQQDKSKGEFSNTQLKKQFKNKSYNNKTPFCKDCVEKIAIRQEQLLLLKKRLQGMTEEQFVRMMEARKMAIEADEESSSLSLPPSYEPTPEPTPEITPTGSPTQKTQKDNNKDNNKDNKGYESDDYNDPAAVHAFNEDKFQ